MYSFFSCPYVVAKLSNSLALSPTLEVCQISKQHACVHMHVWIADSANCVRGKLLQLTESSTQKIKYSELLSCVCAHTEGCACVLHSVLCLWQWGVWINTIKAAVNLVSKSHNAHTHIHVFLSLWGHWLGYRIPQPLTQLSVLFSQSEDEEHLIQVIGSE